MPNFSEFLSGNPSGVNAENYGDFLRGFQKQQINDAINATDYTFSDLPQPDMPTGDNRFNDQAQKVIQQQGLQGMYDTRDLSRDARVRSQQPQTRDVLAPRVDPSNYMIEPGNIPEADPRMVEAGQLSEKNLEQYMNPFTGQVVENTVDEMRRTTQRQNRQARSGAVAQGAYGGSRAALLEAENNRNLMDRSAEASAELQRQNFQQAVNQAKTDITNRLQAQRYNQTADLTADQANMEAGLERARANQRTGLRAGLSNQEAALEASRANARNDLREGRLQQNYLGMAGDLAANRVNQSLNMAGAFQNLSDREKRINQIERQNANMPYKFPLQQLQRRQNFLAGTPPTQSAGPPEAPSFSDNPIPYIQAGTGALSGFNDLGGFDLVGEGVDWLSSAFGGGGGSSADDILDTAIDVGTGVFGF